MSAASALSGPTRDFLDWPFFGPEHRDVAAALDGFAASAAISDIDHVDIDASCRKLVRALGDAGLLAIATGDAGKRDIDSRALCLARETLAWHDGLADFAFAMQGLGTGAVGLGGSGALRETVLAKATSGEWLSAFALSESDAGSDVAAMTCAARLDGTDYVLDGEKTWISNGGIADVYTVFARTGEAPGTRGISAFVVFADDPGFLIKERIDVIEPHPLATIRFDGCRIPADRLLGKAGEGFKLAMRTLDIFRASVAAAGLGLARRAFDEALLHARSRKMFGATLGDLQMTQAALADMATGIESSALLTYRAAWKRDVLRQSTTREAAMAKLTATESAQKVIDSCVQMFGARGVVSGSLPEKLYRDIRALRIYEGASEVQKLIIARDYLKQS